MKKNKLNLDQIANQYSGKIFTAQKLIGIYGCVNIGATTNPIFISPANTGEPAFG